MNGIAQGFTQVFLQKPNPVGFIRFWLFWIEPGFLKTQLNGF